MPISSFFGNSENDIPIPNVVNAASGAGTGNSISQVLGFTPSEGNMLFAFITQRNGTNPVTSDNNPYLAGGADESWVRVENLHNFHGTTVKSTDVWYTDPLPASPGSTFSASLGTSDLYTWILLEVENLKDHPIATSAKVTDAIANTQLTGTITRPTKARSMLLNFFSQNRGTATFTSDAGWTVEAEADTGGGSVSHIHSAVTSLIMPFFSGGKDYMTSPNNEGWQSISMALNGHGSLHGFRGLGSYPGDPPQVVQTATAAEELGATNFVLTCSQIPTPGNLLAIGIGRADILSPPAAQGVFMSGVTWTQSGAGLAASAKTLDWWIAEHGHSATEPYISIDLPAANDAVACFVELEGLISSGTTLYDQRGVDGASGASMPGLEVSGTQAGYAIAAFLMGRGTNVIQGLTGDYSVIASQGTTGGGGSVSLALAAYEQFSAGTTSVTGTQSGNDDWMVDTILIKKKQ